MNPHESPWRCLLCDVPIALQSSHGNMPGVSLTDEGEELHVCRQCWDKFKPAEKLEVIRRWRLTAAQQKAIEHIAEDGISARKWILSDVARRQAN